MRRRQPLPRLWLMTDERQRGALWRALDTLPRGSGVIFRHYGMARAERRVLFEQVKAITRRRGLVLLLAGSPAQAFAWGADGSHGRGNDRRYPGARTAPVHGIAEMRAAERSGATLLFVSPVFPTRSHPNGHWLGVVRFGLLAGRARRPVVALGGVTARNAARLTPFGIYGWAAIDSWTGAT